MIGRILPSTPPQPTSTQGSVDSRGQRIDHERPYSRRGSCVRKIRRVARGAAIRIRGFPRANPVPHSMLRGISSSPLNYRSRPIGRQGPVEALPVRSTADSSRFEVSRQFFRPDSMLITKIGEIAWGFTPFRSPKRESPDRSGNPHAAEPTGNLAVTRGRNESEDVKPHLFRRKIRPSSSPRARGFGIRDSRENPTAPGVLIPPRLLFRSSILHLRSSSFPPVGKLTISMARPPRSPV